MIIKTDIESALQAAQHDSRSLPCTYDDFLNPDCWELYQGSSAEDFHNGEIVLIAWDATEPRCDRSAYYDWTFRRYDKGSGVFQRNHGTFGVPDRVDRWREFWIYRYVGVPQNETEISCAGLEDVV